MRGFGSSIRSRLVLLVLAATLPMLVFSAILLERAYRVSVGLVEGSTVAAARQVAASVDALIGRAEAVGLALAQLPPSELADMSDFEDAAGRALASAGLDSALSMTEADGTVVAHTMHGRGTVLHRLTGPAAAQRVFETGRTEVTDLFVGPNSQQLQVAVQVPVLRDGKVRYAIGVMLPTDLIAAGSGRDALPERWFELIADRAGQVIDDRLETNAASREAALAALVRDQREGFVAMALAGGERVLIGFTHGARTGWLIGVGVPAWVVRGPALRSIGALAAGGGGVLLASLGLAWLIGRNIVRPLNLLAHQAARLGQNEPVNAEAGQGLAEAEAVAQAMHRAAVQLSTRAAEREAALRRAEAGESRLEAEVAARTAELAQSEERFRTYFEYSSDALVMIGVHDGRFVYETINRAAERLFGLRARDVSGQTVSEVLCPETAAQALAGYRSAVASGGPVTLERTLVMPAGVLELETILVPVLDSDSSRPESTRPGGNRVVRIISGSRDLTERKRIENRLAHAQRLEAVGQLTGGVAHDFNNLLTIIIGNLSLLRRRLGEDPRALRYLAGVENAAERGAKLTASLLAFSRRQALQVERIDIGQLIGESATLLQRALGEEIELAFEIAPNLPAADVDAGQLEAAVLNLAINARDAIREARTMRADQVGWLRITVGEHTLKAGDLEGNEEAVPGRFLAIEVADNGNGMPHAVRSRAFEPFFTTKEIGRGTGLGLSQVFGFVRQLGGHVTLDSAPGQGTAVTMYLPASDGAATPSIPAAEPRQLPQDKTVLVVEDDRHIRDITAEVLGDAGATVITAEDGAAAMAILRGPTRVDLLFSDVVMPGGATGVMLAGEARAERPGLAVLLTSGHTGSALSSLGADSSFEVLAKPYSRATLLERVGAMLTPS